MPPTNATVNAKIHPVESKCIKSNLPTENIFRITLGRVVPLTMKPTPTVIPHQILL